MSDRRAVSAGHLGVSSVAATNEPWRVAVGGNRVQSMTIEQIAQAFHAGQLTVRTPLWPPGTSGWQALGNFEQFQHDPSAYGSMPANHLAQFEEADDDPTRMWTGSTDMDLIEMDPMPAAPVAPPVRASSQTGTRQVSSRAARPAPSAVASQPVRYAQAAPIQSQPGARRQGRGNGLLLVAGLVGLVGLGSAVLAARGSWSSAALFNEATSANPTILADPAPAGSKTAANAPAGAKPASGAPEMSGAQLAKYDEAPASAFVAGGEAAKSGAQEPADNEPTQPKGNDTEAGAAKSSAAAVDTAAIEAPGKSAREKARAEERSPTAARQKALVKGTSKRTAAAAPKSRSKPEPEPEAAKTEAKAETKTEAKPEPSEPPANASVNEAAAAALGTSANLASSCRPRGGPAGPGKARIIYSNDGDVQSVEILTAKFRDTLTGSCVRMVFRRAKIPPFKGEPPTFIKSFTIPEE